MAWDEISIDVGFGGDETAQFGPRNEKGSKLYQIDTIACVTPASATKCSVPKLFSVATPAGICVAVENHLAVFSDPLSEAANRVNFTFSSPIDRFCASNDGKFVAIGERCGDVNIAMMSLERVVFSQQVSVGNGDETFCGIEIIESSKDGVLLLLLLKGGRLMIFSHLDLKGLETAITNQDAELASEIKKRMSLEEVDFNGTMNEVFSLSPVRYLHQACFLVTGQGGNALAVLHKDFSNTYSIMDACSIPDKDIGIIKSSTTPDGQFLVCLDEEKHLSIWNSMTLTIYMQWNQVKVKDFLLCITASETDSERQSNDDIKIVTLTESNDGTKCLLQVFSLLSQKHVYTLEVSQNTVLTINHGSQDAIFFIEGANDELDDSLEAGSSCSDVVTSVRVRCLTEAMPDNRLSRLLHRKQFTEAKVFAKQYGLDLELVLKVQSTHILDMLSPWGTESSIYGGNFTELVNELKSCLDQITEKEHIVYCCLQASMPTLDMTYNLLKYARKKALTMNEDTEDPSPVCRQLIDGLNRFVTYEVAFGANKFSDTHWSEFLSADLLSEIIKLFGQGQVHAPVVIWQRHKSEFEKDLDFKRMRSVLVSISDAIQSHKLIPWLRDDFVPFVLTFVPEGQAYLASWLERRALQMESCEKDGWPGNAINLIEVLFNAFSNLSKSQDGRGFATPNQYSTQICKLTISCSVAEQVDPNEESLSQAMSSLRTLLNNLKDLLSLHQTYSCKLKLDEFLNETTETIAFRFLDRVVAAELVANTINNYVRPYAVKNCLPVDPLLLNYVENLSQQSQGHPLWENKALEVVKCIECLETKCQAINYIIALGNGSWSEAMEAVVKGLCELCPENIALKRLLIFSEMKKMLSAYNIYDRYDAKRSAEYILLSMISQDKPSSLDDAIKFAIAINYLEINGVYLFQILHWIKKNKVSESCQLLLRLQSTTAIEIFSLVFHKMETCLADEEITKKSEPITQTLAVFLRIVSKVAVENPLLVEEFEEKLKQLRKIYALRVEFGISMSLDDYRDEAYRNLIFDQHSGNDLLDISINPDSMKKTSAGQSVKFGILKIKRNRLAELLCLPQTISDGKLMEECLAARDIETILKHCRILQQRNPNGEQLVFLSKVVHCLLVERLSLFYSSRGSVWSQDMEAIKQFIFTCVTYCHNDSLRQYFELSRVTSIVADIALNCESADYQEDAYRHQDQFTSFLTDNWYKDDGLVLSSSEVIPLLKQFNEICFPDLSDDLLMYETDHFSGCKDISSSHSTKYLLDAVGAIISMLECNGLQELAFNIDIEIRTGIDLQQSFTECEDVDDNDDELTDEDLLISLQDPTAITTTNAARLFTKVLTHRRIDHDRGLAYFCLLPPRKGTDVIASLRSQFGSKFNRLKALAKIGIDYTGLRSDLNSQVIYERIEKCSDWGQRLQKLQITCNDIFDLANMETEKMKVVESLVCHQNVTFNLLMEFCTAFGVDKDDVILLFTRTLLLASKQNNKKVFSKEKMLSVIEDALLHISTKNVLVSELVQCSRKISSYDYERLHFVLHQLVDIDPGLDHSIKLSCEIMNWLSTYVRHSKPGDFERSYSIQEKNSEEVLPWNVDEVNESDCEWSEQRLPFHPLCDGYAWKIIREELVSEEAARKLAEIAGPLKLPQDQLYSSAIYNIIQTALQDSNGKFSHQKAAAFKFNSVGCLLDEIGDFKTAISICNWTARKLPAGNAKVKCYEACVALAKQWKNGCSTEEDVKEALESHEKFMAICCCQATNAVLWNHGITGKEYVALCDNPGALIFKLYEDYGVKAEVISGVAKGIPDIHQVTDDIASINKYDIRKIKKHLFEKWIPSCHRMLATTEDADTSIIDLTATDDKQYVKDNADNLKRLIYLLCGIPVDENAAHLWHYIKQDSPKITNICRVRALQALFALAPPQNIEAACSASVDEIRRFLCCLVYTAELEGLHLSQTVQAFAKCSKPGLVKGLWRNHANEERGVRLICDLCLDNKIYDKQLWDNLLRRLFGFGLIPYLQHVLIALSGVQELRDIPCLVKIWREVIMHPFKTVSLPLSNEDDVLCRRSFELVERCPVVLDIELKIVANLFAEIGFHVHALRCLLLIPDKNFRTTYTEALFSKVGRDSILDCVIKEQKRGHSSGHIESVEDEIFRIINTYQSFTGIEKHTLFPRFVHYIIRSKCINNLLVEILKQKRLTAALPLIERYYEFHPNEIAHRDARDQYENLVFYLEQEGLTNELDSCVGNDDLSQASYEDSLFVQ